MGEIKIKITSYEGVEMEGIKVMDEEDLVTSIFMAEVDGFARNTYDLRNCQVEITMGNDEGQTQTFGY